MKLTSERFKEVKQIPGWAVPNSVRKEALAWVEALLSGSYPQTKSALRCGDAYCCLGVLTTLQETVEWSKSEDGHMWYPKINGELMDDSYLCEAIAKKFNMEERGLSVEVLDDQGNLRWVTLAALNDQSIPFKEIGQIIGLAMKGGYHAPKSTPQPEVQKKG
ncbi:hypothetical protein D3C87_459900 [compost metagenome]